MTFSRVFWPTLVLIMLAAYLLIPRVPHSSRNADETFADVARQYDAK